MNTRKQKNALVIVKSSDSQYRRYSGICDSTIFCFIRKKTSEKKSLYMRNKYRLKEIENNFQMSTHGVSQKAFTGGVNIFAIFKFLNVMLKRNSNVFFKRKPAKITVKNVINTIF